jgi:hypothetical protein
MVLVTVTGWYRTKRPMQLLPFLIYYVLHLSFNYSRFIHHTSLLRLQQTPSSGGEEIGREMAAEIFLSVSL